jgi:hypothetical protein
MIKVGHFAVKVLAPKRGKKLGSRIRRSKFLKSGILWGLNVRQRAFVREKILGSMDKEAALAAGYSPSVADNTKQKIWAKPAVRSEFERLKERFWSCRENHIAVPPMAAKSH